MPLAASSRPPRAWDKLLVCCNVDMMGCSRWACSNTLYVLSINVLSFKCPHTHMQSAMVSMTEVLAQAVYGLNLNELPLEVLAAAPNRSRASSMGRRGVTVKSPVRQDFLLPRMPSFPNVSIIQPPPHHHPHWRIGVGVAHTPTSGGDTGSSLAPKRELVKSLPSTNAISAVVSSKPQLSAVPRTLPPIKEQVPLEQEPEAETMDVSKGHKSANPTLPPLRDSKKEGEKDAVVDEHPVCTRDNVVADASPNHANSYPRIDLGHKANQDSSGLTGQDLILAKPPLGMKAHGESSNSSNRRPSLLQATTSLFKLRSPEAKLKKKSKISPTLLNSGEERGDFLHSSMPTYKEDEVLVGKAQGKKQVTHKRSGSDTTSIRPIRQGTFPRALVKLNSHSHEKVVGDGLQEESSRKSDNTVATATCTRKEQRKPFYLRKSYSDGNIHLLPTTFQTYISISPGKSEESVFHQDRPFLKMVTVGDSVLESGVNCAQNISVAATTTTLPLGRGSTTATTPPKIMRSVSVNSPESTGNLVSAILE